ncbi:MAG: hypothetical protein Q7U66_12655, partial [Methylobacter sp.]|nr:hypothetical protein [Methylobacter sp.]
FPIFKIPNPATYTGWVFNAGFASFMANPNLIRFPLYAADSKTGKLQSMISILSNVLTLSILK